MKNKIFLIGLVAFPVCACAGNSISSTSVSPASSTSNGDIRELYGERINELSDQIDAMEEICLPENKDVSNKKNRIKEQDKYDEDEYVFYYENTPVVNNSTDEIGYVMSGYFKEYNDEIVTIKAMMELLESEVENYGVWTPGKETTPSTNKIDYDPENDILSYEMYSRFGDTGGYIDDDYTLITSKQNKEEKAEITYTKSYYRQKREEPPFKTYIQFRFVEDSYCFSEQIRFESDSFIKPETYRRSSYGYFVDLSKEYDILKVSESANLNLNNYQDISRCESVSRFYDNDGYYYYDDWIDADVFDEFYSSRYANIYDSSTKALGTIPLHPKNPHTAPVSLNALFTGYDYIKKGKNTWNTVISTSGVEREYNNSAYVDIYIENMDQSSKRLKFHTPYIYIALNPDEDYEKVFNDCVAALGLTKKEGVDFIENYHVCLDKEQEKYPNGYCMYDFVNDRDTLYENFFTKEMPTFEEVTKDVVAPY